jgi:hypothetical protein
MSKSESESETRTETRTNDYKRVTSEAARIEDQLACEGHTGVTLAETILSNLEDRSVTTDTLADAIRLHRKLAAQDHSLADMASVLVDRIHRLAAGSTRTGQRRDRPTNYPGIRESFALALEAEAPEDKAAVLQTVDDAVANHSHQLHFPGDGPVEPIYSALIVHEDGSGIDSRIVGQRSYNRLSSSNTLTTTPLRAIRSAASKKSTPTAMSGSDLTRAQYGLPRTVPPVVQLPRTQAAITLIVSS